MDGKWTEICWKMDFVNFIGLLLCCPFASKVFPFRVISVKCGMCVRGFFEHRKMLILYANSESANITIRSIIKSIHKNSPTNSKCDDKIIELMKRELVKHNNGIPRYFNIRFNAREKKINIYDEDEELIDNVRYNDNFELNLKLMNIFLIYRISVQNIQKLILDKIFIQKYTRIHNKCFYILKTAWISVINSWILIHKLREVRPSEIK